MVLITNLSTAQPEICQVKTNKQLKARSIKKKEPWWFPKNQKFPKICFKEIVKKLLVLQNCENCTKEMF
jgi:hypothetical protein